MTTCAATNAQCKTVFQLLAALLLLAAGLLAELWTTLATRPSEAYHGSVTWVGMGLNKLPQEATHKILFGHT